VGRLKLGWLEGVENDLHELKMMRWRQRQIIEKSGKSVIKEAFLDDSRAKK
jgi:hypothetical protein